VPRITDDYQGYSLFINYNDHPPEHFDVRGNGHRCRIAITTGDPMDATCDLPDAVLKTLRTWTDAHRNELFVNWRRAERHERLLRIAFP
jgi:hypothetical protein